MIGNTFYDGITGGTRSYAKTTYNSYNSLWKFFSYDPLYILKLTSPVYKKHSLDLLMYLLEKQLKTYNL